MTDETKSSTPFSSQTIDWKPFTVCAFGEKAPYSRSISTPEGLGDRLRAVAFAEKQAIEAFTTAAKIFVDAPSEVRDLWLTLAEEERKHLDLLLHRMRELGVSVDERPQSLALWQSFDHCKTAKDFAFFMARAEDRGRDAGEKFYDTLLKIDAPTAELFKKIAKEEEEHIRLAANVLNLL